LIILKKKILLFLSNNYHLFWALGLTAGIYTGGIINLACTCMAPAGITVIVVLLAFEVIIAVRVLSGKDSSGCSYKEKVKKIEENYRDFLSVSKPVTGPERKNTEIFITAIIPFFILFFIGILIIGIYDCRESENIAAAICENENQAGSNGDTSIIIEGRVSDHPAESYSNINFTMAVEKISVCGSGRNPDEFLKIREYVSVRLNNAAGASVSRDDYLQVKGSFKKKGLKNFRRAGHGDNGYIFTAGCSDAGKIGSSSPGYKMFVFRNRLYSCLKNAFYRNLENENACIAEAIILGNKNNLRPYLAESFKKCGVYHLFAISGLHLSFFISFIYLIFKRVRSSGYILGAVIIFLVIYNFLVGERASMLRASITVVLIFLAGRWNREYSHKIILYFSYIALIIYNPYFIYSAGFWMTFGSMAALSFIYPFLSGAAARNTIAKGPVTAYFLKIIFITLSVQIVLFPVLVYFFNEVSLISPLANVLIIPAFYILLFIMIFSSLTIIIWPPAGGFILRSGDIFFRYILKTAGILARFNFCVIRFDDSAVKNVIVCYAVLFILSSAIYILVKIIRPWRGKF
jgi:ComEC/Rec2-related protein